MAGSLAWALTARHLAWNELSSANLRSSCGQGEGGGGQQWGWGSRGLREHSTPRACTAEPSARLQAVQVVDPGVAAERLGDEVAQRGVAEGQPAAGRDAVGLVLEALWEHIEEGLEDIVAQDVCAARGGEEAKGLPKVLQRHARVLPRGTTGFRPARASM